LPNSLNTNPVSVDADLASFGAAQSLQAKPFGLRVYKVSLVAAATTTAGTVTITNPVDGSALYDPILVAAGLATGASHSERQHPATVAMERFQSNGRDGDGNADIHLVQDIDKATLCSQLLLGFVHFLDHLMSDF
jgi:hypothetical protein